MRAAVGKSYESFSSATDNFQYILFFNFSTKKVTARPGKQATFTKMFLKHLFHCWFYAFKNLCLNITF